MRSVAILLTLVLNPPHQFPPLGVVPGKTTAFTRQFPGTIYEQQIILGAERLDDPEKIRSTYSTYIFDQFLDTGGATDKASAFRLSASRIFSAYYLSSFSDKKPPTDDKWDNALWEIRSRYGKDFADKALFYTFKTWDDPVTEAELRLSFDVFFSDRFRHGVYIEDNNLQNAANIAAILKTNGIPLE
jgi:hypothetical protein